MPNKTSDTKPAAAAAKDKVPPKRVSADGRSIRTPLTQ
ncbi:MAG: MerR family transcriptional regulator, partial [Mesorhizobium sp.]